MPHRILNLLPPKLAHLVALEALKRVNLDEYIENQPTTAAGITVPNRVGLAAGFDKDGEAIAGLAGLGFGFIEIGTVTPSPQPGLQDKKYHRLVDTRSLINRLGLPSKGIAYLTDKLMCYRHQYRRKQVVGVSIAPNHDMNPVIITTFLEYCIDVLGNHPDFITINPSSPNGTSQDLQHPDWLLKSIDRLARVHGANSRPIWLKLSPDLDPQVIVELGKCLPTTMIKGVVLGNASSGILKRAPVEIPNGTYPIGGLSGELLRPAARELLERFLEASQGKIDTISCGGISMVDDVEERLRMGAKLVQIHTGLIYHGHTLPAKLARGYR